MKINIVCKILVLAIFLGLAAFSGTFVLVDKEDDICKSSGKQLIETLSNESSPKGVTDAKEDNIIQKVNLQNSPVDSQDYWEDSEAFIIDTEKFEESAATGNVNMRLLESNFEIEFDEIIVSNGNEFSHYSGHVKGVPYSKAEFYVYGEVFCGSIEFCDLTYTIAVTSEEYNGKTVHVIFLINWENERDKIKNLLNPLSFLRDSGPNRGASSW
jgi:hypothetical protein